MERQNYKSASTNLLYMILYHINCGVIQGFLALRKAATTHVKKYRIFYVRWYSQSATERHLPLAPLGQVDEWMAKSSRFSIHGHLSDLSRIVAAKTLKYPYRWQTVTNCEVQTFLEGEKNQYTKRKTESYAFSGFGVGISRGLELKSTTGRFVTGRFWSFT